MKKSYTKSIAAAFAMLAAVPLGMNAQLSGVYTINGSQSTGGTNFQTFGALASALTASGVAGGVTVNVTSGTYNEQPLFGSINGTSANNRITINGNGALLVFNSTSSSQPWTLGINGADYMTFNNLNVEGQGSSYAMVVDISGGSDYNNFNGCVFKAPVNGTSSYHCPFVITANMTSPTSTGANSGNFNTVTSCTMQNGYYSFTIFGLTSAPYVRNNSLINCQFTDFYYYSSYVYYSYNTTIRGCTFDRITRTTNSGTIYMTYWYSNNNMLVENCKFSKFFDAQPGNTATIYWYFMYQAVAGGPRNTYRNNIVTDMKHNGSVYPYWYYSAIDCYNNTFDWDYTAGNFTGTIYALYVYSNATYGNAKIYNNIFSIRRPGSGTKYGLYVAVTGNVEADYNDIVMTTTAGTSYMGYHNGNVTTFSAWQALGYEAHGYTVDPQYTSATDLHPTNTAINNAALPMSLVFDYSWAPRSGTTPDIGALEFLSQPCSGTPNPGTIVTPTYYICAGESASMILGNFSSDLGITYQWNSSSTSSVGPWTSIPSATSVVYTAPNVTTTTWYQAVVTCTNSNQSASPIGVVNVAGTTTNTVPYYEGFEGVGLNNRLPNCSWYATNVGSSAETYTAAASSNRVPHSGNGFAAFENASPGTNYFYTNGIWLNAGVTYSAGMWYTTEFNGYANWTDLRLMVGASQSTTGLNTIKTTNGPAISAIHKAFGDTFHVNTSGMYYVAVRATNAAGSAQFLSWDDLSVTIPCQYNVMNLAMAASDETVCLGTGVNLTASGSDTYSWNTGDNGSVVTYSPTSNGLVSVTGTSTLTGCSQTVSKMIYVNPSPAVSIIGNPPMVCPGSPVYLSAVGALTYVWSNGPTTSAIQDNPTTNTNYNVVGTNQYGCTGSAAITVSVLPTPNASINGPTSDVCANDEVVLTGSGGNGYQWFNSIDPTIMQGQAITIHPTTSSTYTLKVTGSNGCVGETQINLSVNACVGLAERSKTNFSVFPNPASTQLTVRAEGTLAYTYTMSDVSGRMVLRGDAHGEANLSIEKLAAGVYYLNLNQDGAQSVIKVVKQ